jgi:hypothetical protein
MSLAGYTQALRPGVKASFGLALDTQRLNEISPTGPTHKVRPSLYCRLCIDCDRSSRSEPTLCLSRKTMAIYS